METTLFTFSVTRRDWGWSITVKTRKHAIALQYTDRPRFETWRDAQ